MKIIGNRKPASGNFTGFTLIELLVVISIIAVLAALTIPVLSAVKASEYKKVAQGELGNLETALENYKAKYGAYPPSNKNPGSTTYDPAILNQLYYELSGVTRDAVKNTFTTLDGATTITAQQYKDAFGVGGVENCTQGGGEDGISAKNFLPGLKQNQFYNLVTNEFNGDKVPTTVLITSVGGPDDGYRPLGAAALNPFRYNSTNPTNNPGSYDLWIDLRIGGKTNRISNWSRQVQILK
jgi:prepilin-type N-terminal cleavage/methylation domain-containing protein